MNYLFYVGIILPTLITICLFLVFIYCWFLQKARKEVLTRRYDPHGKMRRLGLSMEPPPPPDFCRLEATATTPLASHLSPSHYGEDNMAYCVSRSPSTDQQNQQQQQQQQQTNIQPARRSLYHTYHDSGISAGGLAALTESGNIADGGDDEGRSEGRVGPGGLAYRTCPDSGVSGLSGGFYLPGDAPCPRHSCHLNDRHHQLYFEDQYNQQRHQQLPLQQQQQQLRPQHLHHTLVEASVHPTHGVCYGDDTNHPQSPQHYAPPPHHLQHLEQRYNPHHNPIPQQNNSRLGNLQHMQLAAQIHYPSSSSCHRERPGVSCSRRGEVDDDQVFELVSPSASHPKDVHTQDFTTETSFGPQGAMDIMVTSSSDPRIANISLPAQQNIVLSCLVQQQQRQDQLQQLQNSEPALTAQHNHRLAQNKQQSLTSTTPPTKLKTSASTGKSMPHVNHHRDSGIPEDVASASGGSNSSSGTDQSAGNGSSSSNNNTINSSTSSSERPDSQASHSPSTTDSEDSGFRGSHCVNPGPPPQAPVTASRLNKQTNPLLKPMRRPRNKGSRKNMAAQDSSPPRPAKAHASSSISPAQREPSTVANTDSSNPGSPTPLITLDPQNLCPPALLDSTNLGRGLEMIDMADRPASLRTPDSSPNHSPSDWPGEQISSRKGSKDGGLDPGDGIGSVAPGDISTHLSWSYLHGLSSSHGGVARPEGGANHLRQDLHHMDVLGYSVV
ncbi:hypothetical protein ElyMa_000771300 [Elysia marginata]|uniref:Uncharacterized protein n=1 Tax=Elysia marginata TaxID=1093978 RepID=A0AAV4GTH7_9GAST|nr:hypothetical protein ElyMa_000771300 [Elysia marginata]